MHGLLEPGLLGDYDHVEVLEVFAAPRAAAPLNVLSVAVFGEDVDDPDLAGRPTLLTPERIRVEGFSDWTFGVARTLRPVAAMDAALAALQAGRPWALSGQPLRVGPLKPQPPTFAPPDGTAEVPVNRLLKNNFWSGSHLFRLIDPEKTELRPFFDDRRRLQALSGAISPYAPLALAGLADFLGDVLVQLPVTVLVTDVRSPRDGEELNVSVVWRHSAAARPLRAAARMRSEEELTGAAVSEAFDRTSRLPINGHLQPVEAEIWDESSDVLLSATASTSTVKRIELNMNMKLPEPRVFTTRDAAGAPLAARVGLWRSERSFVGHAAATDADRWRRKRQDLEEARRLAETRDFVQYRPEPGGRGERDRALSDVRHLIEAHGDGGVDLWDPYLTAEDLLQTLFWSSQDAAPLRALTAGRDPPATGRQDVPRDPDRPAFAERQRATLAEDAGNLEGLRLEYRTRHGPEGWTFHDRFLIFPGDEGGPSAWSLGTSINSLGLAHHILQRVSNAPLISGAFEDLWRALSRPHHRIWRSW